MSHISDRAASGANHPDAAASRHYFFVTGQTNADLIARVLCPFAKNDVTPYRIHASCENGAGDETTIELRVGGSSACRQR
ncbi:MAG: hypothetical protein KTR19_10590 [Hyphomicrobiales bacterium]|nr:hypothetical protein [Hyphomicrobiales bacterium]